VPELIALIDDPEIRVRRTAISAVSAFKPPPREALPALERALKDKDYQMRVAAAAALGQFGATYPEEVTRMIQRALATEENEKAKMRMNSVLDRLSRSLPDTAPHEGHKPPSGSTGRPNE
jgi:HEAT repeat protein